MVSRNVNVDKTAAVLHSGAVLLRVIRVLQKTDDAPQLFLQVFNTKSPTVGTTAPALVLPVPAGIKGQGVPYTYHFHGPRGGVELGTGLAIAVTAKYDDDTSPDAGDEPDVDVEFRPLG